MFGYKKYEKEDRGEPKWYQIAWCFIKYRILRFKKPYIAYRYNYGYIDWRV